MKRILAHNECDAQKRRDAFGERYNAYIGRGYDLDKIKRDVNKILECKYLRFYLGESYKFKNEPNPIVSFSDGKLQFTEQGLRAALKKKGADPELLKMDIAEMPFDDDVYYASLYFKRKDVMKQVCTITYDCIQMEIKRTYVKGSPFSHYTIIPAKEMWVNCNVIFESDLFNQGVRPAINVGISVSRVGGNAQIKAMKKVAGTLKIDQAQYRELEAFTKFGGDLDPVTAYVIDKGHKNTELLIQPQYAPMPVEEQIAVLYCGVNGLLKEVPTDKVRSFEKLFLELLRATYAEDVLGRLKSGVLNEEVVATIEKVAAEVVAAINK